MGDQKDPAADQQVENQLKRPESCLEVKNWREKRLKKKKKIDRHLQHRVRN
jgi:hypothetical protein